MSTAVRSGESDLEKKFFDLVVQPPAKIDVGVKPTPANVQKVARRPERRRLLDRFERRRLLVGNKKPDKKEVVKPVPLIEQPKQSTPLQVVLTPNPSATVLQCRILQEVKDAEQNSLLLKKLTKESQANEVNCSDDKLLEPQATVPQVIELGLVGVFELIRETASKHNVLCCKALQALLNMLQGQKLEGMKNEPHEVLENLFQTLLELSRLPEENIMLNNDDNADAVLRTSLPGVGPVHESIKVSSNIPSLACSCLLSLVFAWGNTGKLLSVVASFIADCSSYKTPLYIKVPSTFIELQRTVIATILGKDHIPNPLQVGIQQSSLFHSWKIDDHSENLQLISLQCDGSYLYCLFSNALLMKIGTGYNTTVQGYVYKQKSIVGLEGCSKSNSNEPKRLFYFEDSLYCITSLGDLCIVHRHDLSIKILCNKLLKEEVWFCDEGPCSIVPIQDEDSYTFNFYKYENKSLSLRKSLKVHPTKRHLLVLGKSLGFNPIKEPTPEKEYFEIAQVLLGADFSLTRSDKGQVFYSGKSEALGLSKGRNKKITIPELLPLPTTSKIIHISVAPDGGHAILVAESGEVYFTGTSHRGEDGEPLAKNRRQPPQKPKLMKCMEGKHVIGGYCNSGTSCLITKDGKLYLFGKDSTQADSKTGFVSVLNDVRVVQVALGKAHIVIASNDGRLWTAGVNNRGQCGRQEGVMSITQRIAEVELEKDVSMQEDKSMDDLPLPASLTGDSPIAPICSPDKHKWRKDVCMICAVCCECTGYGSSCVNSDVNGRYPGMPCGCGAGWSGCSECGCCRTCAGEADVNSEGKRKDEFGVPLPDADYMPLPGADPSSPFLNKLAVLLQQKNFKKSTNSAARESKVGPSKSDILKEANKMALLPLLQIQLPKERNVIRKATQIACGDHHTVVLTDVGSVCMFGKNNHGQLGLGDTNNRNQPTLVNLPFKVVQISAGSHHTLFLTDTGLVYGCGSNAHGQLGEQESGCSDILSPILILSFQQSIHNVPRVSWLSATQTSTLIKYEEVLLNVTQLEKSKIFGNSSFIGISYQPRGTEEKASRLLLIDKYTAVCHHFNDSNINVSENEQVCIDSSHDILWSLDASDWTVKSYLLCGYKCDSANQNLPFSPQLAIPLIHGSLTTRTQAGLNLLSCINALVTRCPQGMKVTNKEGKVCIDNVSSDTSKAPGKSSEHHTADEYNIVSRFKSHGGGWGYSVHSTEAIRFMTDTDILLGGVGVFGGRGEYSVGIAVYEEVGESEVQGEGELLVETERVPYECGFREKFHVLFEEPIPITSGQWYTVTCKVSGPSSDCGSHGEQHVTTNDSVKFTFRRSKRSNNGTDVSAGQIPELLYCLPAQTPVNETEMIIKPRHASPVQVLSKSFYMSFTERVFESLPYILEWTRTSLFTDVSKKSSRYDDTSVSIVPMREKIISNAISNLSFVFSVCLRLLRVAITQTLSLNGMDHNAHAYVTQCVSLVEAILTDGEIDSALEDATLMPSHDRNMVMSSTVTMVTECHMIMMECIEAFHPTPPRKWSYLHQALDNYNIASSSNKDRMARLLVSVLDSLCQSSVDLVQCLPLFPRTFSNLATVASPSVETASGETPSLSSTAGFYEVAYSLVEIACTPGRVAAKLEEEQITSWNRIFNIEQTKFTNLLLFPNKSLVTSACKLLSSLTTDLSYRATDTTLLMGASKVAKVLSTVMRFDCTDNNRPWNSGNGSPDALCFSVDAEGVNISGFGIYGGGKEEHRYELEFLEQIGDGKKSRWETLEIAKGVYTAKDCGSDHIFNVNLTKSFPVKKNHTYTVRLHNHGDRTCCGERGKPSVKCADGTTFYFTHCEQSTNGTTVSRGQIPTILYQRLPSDDDLPASPGDKWVGTATTPVTAGLAYQRHALNILALVTESAVEIFNSVSSDDLEDDKSDDKVNSTDTERKSEREEDTIQEAGASVSITENKEEFINTKKSVEEKARKVLESELVTYLLPQLFSNIGVLVRQSPHCAVEVMDLVHGILLPLINIQQLSCPTYKDDTKTYSLIVESAHPYKAATVENYRASFPPSVKWMLIEFSSKSQTAQPEDFLQLFLQTSGHNVASEEDLNKTQTHPVLKKMSQDKNWPQDAILLPGHEILFVLETASDYTNSRDQKSHLFYGFRCIITGYESIPPSEQHDGSHLVSELINVAGLASNMLMKVHERLWADDENEGRLSVEIQKDKVDHLRAIESTAAVTLERHSALFLPGLHLDFFPGSSQALSGNLPISEGSKEKLFLHDFVAATPDTTGGRLARWLQPDSYVDPKQCLLQLNEKSLIHTLPTSITIITRDQYGNPVHVPTLKVELSAKPQPSARANQDIGTPFDISSNEPSPVFETRYEATKHRDSRYHAISMMRAYKKYSFEELRIAYPLKRTLKTENILVANVGNDPGTYRATWIPSLAATYTLQVMLDQQLRGPRKLVTVADAPLGSTERPLQMQQGSVLLKFATKNSRGLRIRSNPTLQSLQVGLLEYDDIIEYCEEARNTDGNWVKLSKTSIEKYCNEDTSEGWCISYHKHNGRTFLVPVDTDVKSVTEIDKKDEEQGGLEVAAQQVIKKVFEKATTSGSVSEPNAAFSPPSPFATPTSKSKLFHSPFVPPPAEVVKEWKERIPGEYKLVKSGQSGHNLRYNPNLKAAPVGKLISGSVFMAISVKRNKSGTWLLLHRTDMPQFCEEIPDEGHAWTLAVARDGTQHLQLKGVVEETVTSTLEKSRRSLSKSLGQSVIEQSTNMNNMPSAIRGAVMAKITNPFHDDPSGGSYGEVVDLLVATPPSVTETKLKNKSEALDLRKRPQWKSRVKHHHRSSSESDVLKRGSKSNAAKADAGRGRSPRSSSQRASSRSLSNPGTKRRTSHRENQTSEVQTPSRKTLVERQTKKQKYPGLRSKTPSSKAIRGGQKKLTNPVAVKAVVNDDIPFIDDFVDVEGNILSPGKPDTPDVPDISESKSKINGIIEKKDDNLDKFNKQHDISPLPAFRKQKFIPQRKATKPLQDTLLKPKKSHDSTKALSPLVAECSRAVFAAFVWHEGIVHDAMACASFLKFNNTVRSQMMKHANLGSSSTDGDKSQRRRASTLSSDISGSGNEGKLGDDVDPAPSRPPDTLVHLAMFWDRLSETVTRIAVRNQTLPLPTPVNQNLNCHGDKAPPPSKVPKRTNVDAVANGYNDVEHFLKVPPLKRKAFQRNHHPNMPIAQARRNMQQHMMPYYQPQQQGNGAGEAGDHFKDTTCDLCDKVHPYPVTYHMKQDHPGCGKFAGGLGYNSSGHYCGGWAGDCGDGGVGGSTWYLLCFLCREKYMTSKTTSTAVKKSDQKLNGSWMNRLHVMLLQPTNAHQVMKENAMFLLNLVSASSGTPHAYEQKIARDEEPTLKSQFSGLGVLRDDEINGDKIWDQSDLLPRSAYTCCTFPSIPCAYLAMHGKENGINNNVRPNQAYKLRSVQEHRNRSMSNQATPSSGQFKHIMTQRLSITPDSSPQKTESIMFQRRNKLMRSVSTGSQPRRRRACSGGDVSPIGAATGSFLLHNPSASMKRLMRGRSGNSNNIARDAVHGSYVLPFVTQRHDLKSLHLTLQMTLRRAALRVYVLQALTWLLRTVVTESSIHDILWYFVSALAGTTTNNHKNEPQKNADGDTTDDEIEETKSLYDHPVKDMINAGIDSMMPLVEAFHGFLQTVSDIMMDLPPNSPVQLMAIRCWSLRVLPSDHQFLHQSKVFSHISQILSKVDTKDTKSPQQKLVKVKLGHQNQQYIPVTETPCEVGIVSCLRDLTSNMQIKTSSHTSIANSLTDGSTETFWESGDEDKNKSKSITMDLVDNNDEILKLFVHIDNTRDVQKKVTSVSFFVESDDEWSKNCTRELNTQFVGWLMFDVPSAITKLKIELRGPDNGLRVRQVKLLGNSNKDGKKYLEQLSSQILRAQTCEGELLKVFKLLTAEVFGQLLSGQSLSNNENSRSASPQDGDVDKVTSSEAKSSTSVPASPRDVDPNLREHMVGILFSRSKLTSLQKKVFEHTVQAIHNETAHIRKEWEINLEMTSVAHQTKAHESDTYCFELLSMILALSGSDVGCHYVAQQSLLIEDFISLLHTGTPRIQRQVTLLLRRILSEVTPNQLATVLSARIPCQDKLTDSPVSESPSCSSLSSVPTTSVLDALFACIAKSLSVQVKGTNEHVVASEDIDELAIVKSKRTQTANLQAAYPGRPKTDNATWWMHGSMQDQSTVEAIIKLLADMSADRISPVWGIVTKCAVSESILSLTRLSESEREPDNCLKSPTMWQALASLCVLDRDHVEKLSSARSNQNKNKDYTNLGELYSN